MTYIMRIVTPFSPLLNKQVQSKSPQVTVDLPVIAHFFWYRTIHIEAFVTIDRQVEQIQDNHQRREGNVHGKYATQGSH